LDQSKEPFEPDFLNNLGRSSPNPGEHVERSADSNRERNGQTLPVVLEEMLLPRHAHGDDQNLRPASGNRERTRFALLGGEIAIGDTT
jgi:hypothetical protein